METENRIERTIGLVMLADHSSSPSASLAS
jgi:hypothetical protein